MSEVPGVLFLSPWLMVSRAGCLRKHCLRFAKDEGCQNSLLHGWESDRAFGIFGVQSYWLCNNIPQILSRSTAVSICVLLHVEYRCIY